jgi:transposase
MLQKAQSRKKYPSDLTDEQWAIVAPLIPPAKSGPRGGHPRQVDMRDVLNTLFYLNRSGCQWDMLPHDLLPKSTVYDYFAQWRDDGTWAKMVTDTESTDLKHLPRVNRGASCTDGTCAVAQEALVWADVDDNSGILERWGQHKADDSGAQQGTRGW